MRALMAMGVALLLASCTAESVESSTTEPTPSTVAETTTTVLVPTVDECPAAPYRIGNLPQGVGSVAPDPDEIALDAITSMGGTHTTFYGNTDGEVAIALVRGTFPLEWPEQLGEVFIDGTRGLAALFPDDQWVVAWREQPQARCDHYTMVFYPPVAPSDVEATIASMDRVGG